MQQAVFSEKDEQLRQLLAKLDSVDSEETLSSLSVDDVVSARRQLSEAQSTIRETLDRLRQSQEENEMVIRRRDELESRLTTLETEYEELIGMSSTSFLTHFLTLSHIQRKPFATKTPLMPVIRTRPQSGG